jgi:hypothetical protein
MGDSDRFWRVYRDEWSVVYCSDTDGADGRAECGQRFRKDYEGRVLPEDCRLVPWSLTVQEWWPWMLELRLPVMKGEYSSRPLALEHAHKIDGRVVLEGSREDKKILGYGKKMLREDSGVSPGLDEEGAPRGAPGQES